ncbi:transcriptional regulator, TetR family [Kaistia soli DSM 19436]|uniref:Transcriptional regulator, TetR family n=1 Tax=Kaistia soli DSM 19436 TaxID=1122133 RepID=A0A1M5KJ58_9HYPH|nr:TetR/AcrR family transcriptional regulator [Kaistia soli]SHG52862.1 transcriptional regulator, TetR family [Kaistia soli DSM 19436]
MRPKSETKRRQFIATAGGLFREHGFGAVNMARIAAEAGGSKSTLYNHFPTKEALFEAYVVEAGREPFASLADADDPVENVEAALAALARAYLQLVLSPDVVAINRLVIAEAPRFPELGRIFYENGPRLTLDRLEARLAQIASSGALQIADIPAAALRLKAIAETDLYEKRLWALGPEPSTADIEKAATDAAKAIAILYRARTP